MKKIFCSVVSFLVFSLFVPKGLFPQALESSVSEKKASDSQKYIQRIEWEGDENAWQYGIEIISEENKSHSEITRRDNISLFDKMLFEMLA